MIIYHVINHAVHTLLVTDEELVKSSRIASLSACDKFTIRWLLFRFR